MTHRDYTNIPTLPTDIALRAANLSCLAVDDEAIAADAIRQATEALRERYPREPVGPLWHVAEMHAMPDYTCARKRKRTA